MESQSQLQVPEGTSFLKTYFNGLNALLGLGILSVPYALSQGGWLSLMLLIFVAISCWYTGLLLQRCMNKHPQIKSYSDIGNVAFGYKGRVVVAIFMYLDLYLVAVELLTLGGDSLQYMFPDMNFKIATLSIKGDIGLILLTALVILPTTWLRSLGAVAYISASGVLVCLILMWCVLWAGAVDGVGFHEKGQLMNLRGFPAALSIFNFCYSAHAVFPTLSYSMRDKRQFGKVLLFCFVTSTTGYGLMSIIGYLMFGNYSKSQVILNLPMNKINTHIAIYTSLFVPFTKYAVMVTPIAIAIEDKLRSNSRFSSVLIRTMIVVSTTLVAILVPYFGYVMMLIGALSGVAMAFLLPCLCYLKINVAARKFGLELMVIVGIILAGSLICVFGSYISISEIVYQWKMRKVH